MLRRFNVKNFMSFDKGEDGNSEEFSMIPGKTRNKQDTLFQDGKVKLLKKAAVYGANASGKSNLVKAMQCMKDIIKNNSTKGHQDQYCRLYDTNRDEPSYFEMEILIGSIVYSYGFEVILSQSRFVSEWLLELRPNGSDQVLFERNIADGSMDYSEDWKKLHGFSDRMSVYLEDISADSESLFLHYMNRSKKAFYAVYPEAEVLNHVYDWFLSHLDINFPSNPIYGYAYISDENNMKKAIEIISAFGTGISGYVFEEVSMNTLRQKLSAIPYAPLRNELESQFNQTILSEQLQSAHLAIRLQDEFYTIALEKNQDPRCSVIKFHHENKSALFQFGEESDGTQRLWDLIEILLTNESKTYVIDEIDRCLHPALTYKFIEIFEKFAKDRRVQLIVTTHESRLMDFELLRRDEIWFVNKRNTGESDIYSLEEFNTRFDQKVDKAYLDGRYGGVPIFTTLFPIGEEQ